jgi:hypothetical protein
LSRQYDGGAEYLASELESAALVNKRIYPTREMLAREYQKYYNLTVPANFDRKKTASLRNAFRYSMATFDRFWPQGFFNLPPDISNPQPPCEKATSFERNFNNEFFAKRTEKYYTFLNIGNADWRFHNLYYLTTPFPEGTSLKDGKIYSSYPSRPWLPLQGVELFWTPKFGQFLSRHNWSMFSHQLLRLDLDGKVADFPTSFSCEAAVESDGFSLINRTKHLGIKTRRHISLEKDGLGFELSISSPVKLKKKYQLIEQLPYLIKKDMAFTKIDTKVNELRAYLPSGAGIKLIFSRPVTVRRGPVSSAAFNPKTLKIGLLEIIIDEQFDGSECRFAYKIKADDR